MWREHTYINVKRHPAFRNRLPMAIGTAFRIPQSTPDSLSGPHSNFLNPKS